VQLWSVAAVATRNDAVGDMDMDAPRCLAVTAAEEHDDGAVDAEDEEEEAEDEDEAEDDDDDDNDEEEDEVEQEG